MANQDYPTTPHHHPECTHARTTPPDRRRGDNIAIRHTTTGHPLRSSRSGKRALDNNNKMVTGDGVGWRDGRQWWPVSTNAYSRSLVLLKLFVSVLLLVSVHASETPHTYTHTHTIRILFSRRGDAPQLAIPFGERARVCAKLKNHPDMY